MRITNPCYVYYLCCYITLFTYVALPVIAIQPVSVLLKVDYKGTALWCSTNGIGPIHYQWEKYQSFNDSWVTPVNRVDNGTSPNLKFNKVSEEDEGIYHCIITNDDGSVVSNNATITVYGTIYVCVLHYCSVCGMIKGVKCTLFSISRVLYGK